MVVDCMSMEPYLYVYFPPFFYFPAVKSNRQWSLHCFAHLDIVLFAGYVYVIFLLHKSSSEPLHNLSFELRHVLYRDAVMTSLKYMSDVVKFVLTLMSHH
jgi:hypothetical protein